MTTTTVPIEITCPDWCDRPATEHAEQLWDWDGTCIHYSADAIVRDTEGFHGALEQPQFHPPIELYMTAQTNPEGREVCPPVLHLGGIEMSVSQALALADEIRRQVELYRFDWRCGMSTMPTGTTVPLTVEDYTHPEWCDVTLCQPFRIHENGGEHVSPGTRVGMQGWEAEALVQLVLADDILNGENHAVTRLWLKMASHASEQDTKHEFRADAHLDPMEARMLAAVLNQYADRADRENKFRWAGRVQDIPKYLH